MAIASIIPCMDCDVAIAGGGPAGLALAIATRLSGLSAVVFERGASPPDKACGEGLMPPAVRALDELGVRKLIDPAFIAPFEGLRIVSENGAIAEARLPAPGGLGVRRTALTTAMVNRALELGAEIRERTSVAGYRVEDAGVSLQTDHGLVRARFLAAADGVASRLRAIAGLHVDSSGPRRFGMRQHFRIAPWSRSVEVHLGDGVEAYVTPVGAERVGIAFLWEEDGAARECASIEKFLEHFPALRDRVADAPIDSRQRGAGPMARGVRSRIADRFALLGDAAGYVDAITGEGISLALTSALELGRILPAALEQGASRAALLGYEHKSARRFRRYAWVTRTVLAIARRPAIRRPAVAMLARYPGAFDALVKFALTDPG